MPDCIFCAIAAHQIPATVVFEDDNLMAFKDLHPQAPIHVLIVPKVHVASLNEVGADHERVLGRIPGVAARLAQELGIAESGYRLVTNCGPDAGQTVFHLHTHLLGGRDLMGQMG